MNRLKLTLFVILLLSTNLSAKYRFFGDYEKYDKNSGIFSIYYIGGRVDNTLSYNTTATDRHFGSEGYQLGFESEFWDLPFGYMMSEFNYYDKLADIDHGDSLEYNLLWYLGKGDGLVFGAGLGAGYAWNDGSLGAMTLQAIVGLEIEIFGPFYFGAGLRQLVSTKSRINDTFSTGFDDQMWYIKLGIRLRHSISFFKD